MSEHGKNRRLLGLLRSMRDAAYENLNSTKVNSDRARAIKYYMGEPFGNEVKGRSKAVSRDTMDVIEWIMPMLMKVFLSDNEIVEFMPEGPEDVELAEQQTAMTNYVVMRQNPAFTVFYDWFKSALLMKTAFAKAYYDPALEVTVSNFTSLSEAQLAKVLQKEDTELLERSQNPDGTYDVKVKTVLSSSGKIRIEVPKPESIIFSPGTIDIRDTDFVGELFEATKSDLIKAGFDPALINEVHFGSVNFMKDMQVENARHTKDGNYAAGIEYAEHPSMQKALLCEAYIRFDMNGDGVNELVQVIFDDNVILSMEEVDEVPYHDLTAIRVPHKLIGLSLADMVKDIQEIKSAVVRGVLDNMYYKNFGRWEVVDGQVNIQDLISPSPMQPVRVTAPGMLRQLDVPDLDASTFPLLEYLDRVREDRTGVNKVSQGLDPNALTSNVAAGALDKAMTAAQERIEMIARLFAETGVKSLFSAIYGLIVRNMPEKKYIRLNNEFVEIDPYDWKEKADLVIKVGLGNQSSRNKLAELIQIRDTMMMALQVPNSQLVKQQNIYHLGQEMVKAMGRKDTQKFFTDPGPKDPPPPVDPEIQIKSKQLELDAKEVEIKERAQILKEREFEWQTIRDTAELKLEESQKRPVGLD